jgi:hypothetical protein
VIDNTMTDGGDDDQKPQSPRVAEESAEAIRTLNHLTLGGDDLRYPADVYSVLGSLATLAARLPQALQQLTGFLERQLQDGRIQMQQGFAHAGEPEIAVTDASMEMEEAGQAAEQLRAALDRAQQALSGASYVEPDVPSSKP